jgi:hypothetical protein
LNLNLNLVALPRQLEPILIALANENIWGKNFAQNRRLPPQGLLQWLRQPTTPKLIKHFSLEYSKHNGYRTDFGDTPPVFVSLF